MKALIFDVQSTSHAASDLKHAYRGDRETVGHSLRSETGDRAALARICVSGKAENVIPSVVYLSRRFIYNLVRVITI